MVATGGTAIAALKMMKEWGLEMDKVSFLGIIASQSAVDSITKAFPQVDVSHQPEADQSGVDEWTGLTMNQ